MSNYEAIYNDALADAFVREPGDRGIDAEAHTAGLAAVVAAAKADAMGTLLALHKPEARYHPRDIDDRSWDTVEEAREYADTCDEVMESFEICAECGRVESEQLREYADEWGYRESLWPCETVKATQ